MPDCIDLPPKKSQLAINPLGTTSCHIRGSSRTFPDLLGLVNFGNNEHIGRRLREGILQKYPPAAEYPLVATVPRTPPSPSAKPRCRCRRLALPVVATERNAMAMSRQIATLRIGGSASTDCGPQARVLT